MTKRTRILLGISVIVTLVTGALAFYRTGNTKKQLIGTWTFVSGSNRGDIRLTFAEDGQVKATKRWGRDRIDLEGTYAVRGETIEMLLPGDDTDDWTAKYGDRGEWANGIGKPGESRSEKATKISRPTQSSDRKLRRMTIRSISEAELIVANERDHKTIYIKK